MKLSCPQLLLLVLLGTSISATGLNDIRISDLIFDSSKRIVVLDSNYVFFPPALNLTAVTVRANFKSVSLDYFNVKYGIFFPQSGIETFVVDQWRRLFFLLSIDDHRFGSGGAVNTTATFYFSRGNVELVAKTAMIFANLTFLNYAEDIVGCFGGEHVARLYVEVRKNVARDALYGIAATCSNGAEVGSANRTNTKSIEVNAAKRLWYSLERTTSTVRGMIIEDALGRTVSLGSSDAILDDLKMLSCVLPDESISAITFTKALSETSNPQKIEFVDGPLIQKLEVHCAKEAKALALLDAPSAIVIEGTDVLPNFQFSRVTIQPVRIEYPTFILTRAIDPSIGCLYLGQLGGSLTAQTLPRCLHTNAAFNNSHVLSSSLFVLANGANLPIGATDRMEFFVSSVYRENITFSIPVNISVRSEAPILGWSIGSDTNASCPAGHFVKSFRIEPSIDNGFPNSHRLLGFTCTDDTVRFLESKWIITTLSLDLTSLTGTRTSMARSLSCDTALSRVHVQTRNSVLQNFTVSCFNSSTGSFAILPGTVMSIEIQVQTISCPRGKAASGLRWRRNGQFQTLMQLTLLCSTIPGLNISDTKLAWSLRYSNAGDEFQLGSADARLPAVRLGGVEANSLWALSFIAWPSALGLKSKEGGGLLSPTTLSIPGHSIQNYSIVALSDAAQSVSIQAVILNRMSGNLTQLEITVSLQLGRIKGTTTTAQGQGTDGSLYVGVVAGALGGSLLLVGSVLVYVARLKRQQRAISVQREQV